MALRFWLSKGDHMINDVQSIFGILKAENSNLVYTRGRGSEFVKLMTFLTGCEMTPIGFDS